MKLKCYQTIFGIRKNCIEKKCALWCILFSKDDKGNALEKGQCVYLANSIAAIDLANAVSRLKK